MGSFFRKHIKYYMKKYSRLSLLKLDSDAKFEEKLTLVFKNDEFGKF